MVRVYNLDSLVGSNEQFRQIIHTSKQNNPIQVVVMTLEAGQDIGWEIHKPTQFFHVKQGKGFVVVDGKVSSFEEGDGWVVESGSEHNIIASEKTKLLTIYFPPEH